MELKKVNSEIKNLETDISTKKNDLIVLNKKINELSSKFSILDCSNKAKESEISKITDQNFNIKDQIQLKSTQLETLKKSYKDLFKESKFSNIIAAKEEELSQRLENSMKTRDEAEVFKESSYSKYLSLMKNNEKSSSKPVSRSPSKSSAVPCFSGTFKTNKEDLLQDQEVRRLELEISELEHKKNDQLRYETKRLKECNFQLRSVSHKQAVPTWHLMLFSLVGMLSAVVLKSILSNLH